MRPSAETDEGETNTGRGAGERNHEQEVNQQQTQRLLRIPEQLEGIERHPLGKQKAAQCGDCEQRGSADEDGRKAGLEDVLPQRDQCTADTVAEQRDADDEVGEMVPLDDREKAHQQHFVSEGAGRQQADGVQWW